MLRTRGVALLGAIVPLAALATSLATYSAAADPRVALHGSEVRGLVDAQPLGGLPADQPISVAVSLSLRNADALGSFIDAVSDPRSPLHGRYLTPEQFADHYGPDTATVQQVSDYLRSEGMTVTSVSSNRVLIDASGTVADAERAFGTRLGRWRDPADGGVFFANETAPTVPRAIAASMVGVAGLSDHYRAHHHALPRAVPPCQSGGPPSGAVCPAQARTAYDVPAGFTGSGQHVGLFELDGFAQSNINTYDSKYSLSSPAPTVHTVAPGPGTLDANGGQVEVELDIEVVQAYAPAAQIDVWEGQNTEAGIENTYNAMVTSNTSAANSTSWGQCEPDTTTTLFTTLDSIFMQAAAQGMTFFAASGDTGDYDCLGDPTSTHHTSVTVDNPADDPFVTGAGGTKLSTNSNFTYNTEQAWSDTVTNHGGGGGLSSRFAQPSWQKGTIAQGGSPMRQVPDVALDADPNSGYAIFTGSTSVCKPSAPPCWTQIGGTSAAAPAWAAVTAMFNQQAAAAVKPQLGFANPTLYSLAQAQPTSFHDVTTGSNAISTTPPYTSSHAAASGWDYATGWGSPDTNNLVTNLLALTPPPPSVTTISPTSGPLTGGTQVTVSGNNFSFSGYGATVRTVSFGGTGVTTTPCAQPVVPPCFTVTSATTLTVYSPSTSTAGPVDVRVTTDAGQSPISGGDGFTYQAPSTSVVKADFNGDGKSDVIDFTGSGGGQADVWVALSNGTTFDPPGKWDPWGQFCTRGSTPLVGDFNGDGLADMACIQQSSDGAIYVALSTGTGFSPPTRWNSWGPFCYTGSTPLAGAFTGRAINGHRVDDIACVQQSTDGAIFVASSTGSSFNAPQRWNSWGPFCFTRNTPLAGNFRGGQYDDLVCDQQSSDGRLWVATSNGSSFDAPTPWNSWGPFCYAGSTPVVGQFAGSGKADLVCDQQSANGALWVATSTGTSFNAPGLWNGWGPFCYTGSTPRAGNFNASASYDGLICFQQGNGGNLWVTPATGTSFSSPGQWNPWGPFSSAGHTAF